MVNRNPIKQWFITFPQWEEYSDIRTFKKMVPETDWGLVVKESHENGGIHYHLCCRLVRAMSRANLLKWFMKKFPTNFKRIDFDPTKSLTPEGNIGKGALDYLHKEQLDIYEWGQRHILPKWLQDLKDEWCNPIAIAEQNKVINDWNEFHDMRLRGTYETENPKCVICGLRGGSRCDYCDLNIPQ